MGDFDGGVGGSVVVENDAHIVDPVDEYDDDDAAADNVVIVPVIAPVVIVTETAGSAAEDGAVTMISNFVPLMESTEVV